MSAAAAVRRSGSSSSPARGWRRAVSAWLVVGAAAVAAVPAVAAEAIEVAVRLDGERVIVDVTARAPVPRATAWAVLTDYEHMAGFLSHLKTSTVLSRKGEQLQVEQSGEAKRAFLTFAFTTVRAVELLPEREIRSHLIRGDFKFYQFSTRLGGEAGGPTTVTHHGEYVPMRWVPPVVGPALIESETRRQYTELIAEMVRRAGAGATAAN